jgi:hypothetical protein
LISIGCVADDTYTFTVLTSPIYESTVQVKIELGDMGCFATFSDAGQFEGWYEYYLYKQNGVEVMKTILCSLS